MVGHRELSRAEGVRSPRHRAEYKFRAGEDELLWARLRLRLRRYYQNLPPSPAGAQQHRRRAQSRPRR